MAKRWVKHFDARFSNELHGKINYWLSTHLDVTIVGISVYPMPSAYGAEVIVEEVMWNG